MEFAFWLVKVLFVFKFFMGFVHSDDEINCIWVMRVILFLFSFFNVKLIILLIVYSLESCTGCDGKCWRPCEVGREGRMMNKD